MGMMDDYGEACMLTLENLKRIIGQHGDMCDEVEMRLMVEIILLRTVKKKLR